jgi:hypothetical protein
MMATMIAVGAGGHSYLTSKHKLKMEGFIVAAGKTAKIASLYTVQ